MYEINWLHGGNVDKFADLLKREPLISSTGGAPQHAPELWSKSLWCTEYRHKVPAIMEQGGIHPF